MEHITTVGWWPKINMEVRKYRPILHFHDCWKVFCPLDLSAENATNISCGLLCFHQICQKPTWNLYWQNGINLSHSQQSTSKPMMDCESRMCFCHENSYREPFYPGNLQCHIFLCLSILSDFLALATNAGETLLSHHPLATNPLSPFPSVILLCAKTAPASNTIIKEF